MMCQFFMATPSAQYQSLHKKYETIFDDVMTQYKSGQISAVEAWGRIPGHPRVQYAWTAVTGVSSPFQGNHDLHSLYMDVIRASGRNPDMGQYALDPEWSRVHLGQYSERKNTEADEYTRANTAAIQYEQDLKRREHERTRRGDVLDEQEERIARIVRRVLQEM